MTGGWGSPPKINPTTLEPDSYAFERVEQSGRIIFTAYPVSYIHAEFEPFPYVFSDHFALKILTRFDLLTD